MICANCGNELEPGSRFCDSCGAPVEEKTEIEYQPVNPPVAAYTAPPSATPDYSSNASGNRSAASGFGSDTPSYSQAQPAQNSFISQIQEGDKVAGIERGILAIASLVIGILSMCGSIIPCLGCPMLIIGAGLGFLGLKSDKRVFAIIGLVLAGISLLIAIGAASVGLISYLSSNSSGYYGY